MAPQRLDPGPVLRQARSTSHSANDSSSVLTFHIAINNLYPGIKLPPGDKRWGGYTRNFKPKRHTLESFTADIRAGYSFSPVMKGNHRSRANFISAHHMILDFDDGDESCSLDTLQSHPFIRAHGALLYATPSSTPEAPGPALSSSSPNRSLIPSSTTVWPGAWFASFPRLTRL